MELFDPELNFKDADLNQVELGDRRDFMKGSLAALVGGLVPLWTACVNYAKMLVRFALVALAITRRATFVT